MDQLIVHEFPPIYQPNSRVLILGSFPSVKSRQEHFYYGHPRNRFWPVLAQLLDEPLPKSVSEKKKLLINHGIALYDACVKAKITGSMDKDLHVVELANLEPILQATQIQQIFCNGQKAYDLTTKELNHSAIKLPSTSPANARYKLEDLIGPWQQILTYL